MRITDFPVLEEIRDEYETCRRNGQDREAAVAQLQLSYANELAEGVEDDAPLFWVGLADAQYKLSEISAEVAEKGLAALDALERMDWDICPGDFTRRRQRYATAPMEPRKKFGKSRKFRCQWKLGDTFAYLLSGPDAEEAGIAGRYVLFRKVDEIEWEDGHLYAVVTSTLWDHQPLPTNAEEFRRLAILKVVCGRGMMPKNLYEYRHQMVFTSKRDMESLGLIYLGNFQDIPMPDDEVIVRHPAITMMYVTKTLPTYICKYWKRYNCDLTSNK